TLICLRGPRRLTFAAEPERADRAQVVPQRVGVPAEDLDGLESPQRRIELRGVPVERVERSPDCLLLVALVREREILDPRQRAGLQVGGGPRVRAHRHKYADSAQKGKFLGKLGQKVAFAG